MRPDEIVLVVWVIYKHPEDYPTKYVLRRQYAMRDGSIQFDQECQVADAPAALRDLVPPDLTKVGPVPGDSPAIFEVWI